MSKKTDIYHSNTYDIDGIYNFICQYKKDNDGTSPSIRQIKDACAISSTNIVAIFLRKLEAQGKIKVSGNGLSRGITVIGGRWTVDETAIPTLKTDENKTENKRMNFTKCDKCDKRIIMSGTVRVYSEAKKVFVRLCYICTDDLTGYIPTFTSRRKLGEPLPKGVRA